MAFPKEILPLRTQTVFVGRVVKVVDELIRLATGKLIHHITVQHPGAVVCLPARADGTLLAIRDGSMTDGKSIALYARARLRGLLGNTPGHNL